MKTYYDITFKSAFEIDYKTKGKYVYEKEVEGFQKELIKELIKKNNVLKNEVKNLKFTNNILESVVKNYSIIILIII